MPIIVSATRITIAAFWVAMLWRAFRNDLWVCDMFPLLNTTSVTSTMSNKLLPPSSSVENDDRMARPSLRSCFSAKRDTLHLLSLKVRFCGKFWGRCSAKVLIKEPTTYINSECFGVPISSEGSLERARITILVLVPSNASLLALTNATSCSHS